MAHKLLDGVTAVGVSKVLRLPNACDEVTIRVDYEHGDADPAGDVSALIVKWLGTYSKDAASTGLIDSAALAIGSTAEQWKTGTFNYRINDVNYTKATVAAGAAFTAAHAVTLSKWGVIFCYIDAAGTVSTYVNEATQTTTQTHATFAAAAAVVAPADNVTGTNKCYLGKIIIENNADAGGWDAITDDLTNASDVTFATFLSKPIPFASIITHTFSAAELTAKTATFHVATQYTKYGRLYVSTLTGTAYSIDAYVSFNL